MAYSSGPKLIKRLEENKTPPAGPEGYLSPTPPPWRGHGVVYSKDQFTHLGQQERHHCKERLCWSRGQVGQWEDTDFSQP